MTPFSSPLALLGGPEVIPGDFGPHFTWPPRTSGMVGAVVDQLDAALSIPDRSGVIADLETALAEYFGTRYALLTSSGTAALYSLYAGCRVGPGDEVIVPAYTFYATATPLLHLGAVPVMADCDAAGNLDPRDVANRITDRTFAVMVTHMWGQPANMAALRDVAAANDIMILEDGSHAHGASINGRKVGSFGDGAAFSMNGPKPLSGGEGGFLLTDDSEVYYRALLHGQYGKRCWAEIPEDHRYARYAVTGMGLKHRIHPLAAAIALDQLGNLEGYLTGRDRMARYLREQLADLPGITFPEGPEGVRPSWYGLILQYQPDQLGGLTIERFHAALLAEGCREVDRPGSTCPLNQLPLFQDPEPLFPELAGKVAYKPGEFPTAEAFHAQSLKLPVWHREEDLPLVDRYITAIRKVTENHADLLGQHP